MPPQFDAPALNPNGSLKNAEEMEWVQSPTSKPTPLTLKIPARHRPSSPTPLKIISSTPAVFTNPRKRKADNSAPAATSDPTPTALTRLKGQAGTNAKSKVTKPPVIARVKQDGLHCTGSSTSVKDETADDTASELVKKKHKRGDGATDILTIFKLVDDEDPSQGYASGKPPVPFLTYCSLQKTWHSRHDTTFCAHTQCKSI